MDNWGPCSFRVRGADNLHEGSATQAATEIQGRRSEIPGRRSMAEAQYAPSALVNSGVGARSATTTSSRSRSGRRTRAPVETWGAKTGSQGNCLATALAGKQRQLSFSTALDGVRCPGIAPRALAPQALPCGGVSGGANGNAEALVSQVLPRFCLVAPRP